MDAGSASSRAAGFAHLDRARVVRVETPEHVPLGFELAAVGSRFAAALADVSIILASVLALGLILASLDLVTSNAWFESLGATGAIIAGFALQWGYFFVSEGFFGGRTLGKKALGLRVIGAEGAPITKEAAALRNLLRIVDVQPAGSSLLGLGLVALHPRAQRLGDIVAGTVVVRDRGDDAIPEHQSAEIGVGQPRLDPHRFEVLEKYLTRRDGLDVAVRAVVRESVARAMGSELGSISGGLDEALDRLYEEERPRQFGSTGTSLQAVHLVRTQAAAWKRCRELVDEASSKGLDALSDAELEEFTSLYREVAADLARAKTYGASLRLCFHLERLVGAAHNLFYRDVKRHVGVIDWMRVEFPAVFRRHRRQVAVAATLLFLPALIVYPAVRRDVELGRRVVPAGMVARAEQARQRLEDGDPYIDVPEVQMSVLSSSVITNNVQVAFVAAAGGILAGLGTVFILVFNGLTLGSIFALYDAHGAGVLLWTFVLPHGVLELTAIVVSGAAGLILAQAVLAPGRRTRARALREEGRESLALVGGAAILLVLAGLVEGFVSPARIHASVKWIFAGITALCLFLYLARSGRPPGSTGVREARDP